MPPKLILNCLAEWTLTRVKTVGMTCGQMLTYTRAPAHEHEDHQCAEEAAGDGEGGAERSAGAVHLPATARWGGGGGRRVASRGRRAGSPDGRPNGEPQPPPGSWRLDWAMIDGENQGPTKGGSLHGKKFSAAMCKGPRANFRGAKLTCKQVGAKRPGGNR